MILLSMSAFEKFISSPYGGKCMLAFFIGILVLAVVIAIVQGIMADARARKLDARANERYQAWRREIDDAGGDLPECSLPIRLKQGEVGLYCAHNVELLEPRAVRTGGYGGGSIQVAKGVSIHSGRVQSESHDEWRTITRGSLYVTDRRIIFDGEVKNHVIDIKDVLSVVPGYREATVNSDKLKKPLGFRGLNGQIFADIVDTICDDQGLA